MVEVSLHEYQNRPRELVSSNGFSVEYDQKVTNQELYDDIVSYLGEYRFAVQKYDYELEYSNGALRDSRRGESMSVKAERSVMERMMRGESINREVAEAEGLNFLERQLPTAEVGDSVVWGSPPGEKEEGYGDYGFIYLGQIKRSIENRKQIQMTAIRVEKPTIKQFNKAIGDLTKSSIDYRNAEEFLKTPLVIPGSLDEMFVDQILSNNFSFEMKSAQKEIFDQSMIRLKPRIEEFIARVRWGTSEEKKKAFHALENYSLQVKKELEEGVVSVYEVQESFDDFVKTLGYEPPKVAGSCPIKSGNILAQGFNALNGVLESEWFKCPKCPFKANGPIGNSCPGCGLTKEAYAKESGESCD